MGKMFLTLAALIAGGIANMIFTKTSIYKRYKRPIDCDKKLKDGKRILGDNKTYIGFVSMIFFCFIFQILLGLLCNYFNLNTFNELYNIHSNTIQLNCIFGFFIGFAYMICELPNSFIKRRLNIESGKTGKGIKGFIFFIIDQIDSLLGVVFVLSLFSDISLIRCCQYLLIGLLTHLTVNLILYKMKVRRNI